MKDRLLEVLSVTHRLKRLLQPDSMEQLEGATLLDLIDGYVEHCVRVGKVIPLPERQIFDDAVWAEVLFGRAVPTAAQLVCMLPVAPEYSTPEKYNPDKKEKPLADEVQYIDHAEQRARAGITEQDGPATVKYKLKALLRREQQEPATPDDSSDSELKTAAPAGITLSNDQAKAWVKIQRWVRTDYTEQPYFLLRGYAGTGKSFLLKMMKELAGVQVYYTAPTNKAAKVLGRFVGEKGSTTYSRLGLRLQQDENDENAPMVLVQSKDVPYLPMNSILVVDECGMVGDQLREAIEAAQERCGIKVMYVGDPAQLPPVNEEESGSWHCTDDPKCRAILKQVMRYDSALLTLATAIRECIKAEDWMTPLVEDINADGTGVFKFKTERAFKTALFKDVPNINWSETKVLAWRNKTVEYYNAEIRKRLGYNDDFNVGDHILLAAPIVENGVVQRHTDEEFTVRSVTADDVTVNHASIYGTERIPVWTLECEDEDGTMQILRIAREPDKLNAVLSKFARFAKGMSNPMAKRDAWRFFWDLKARFHRVRFGYALTSHRAQGSTYTNVWVDQADVLANRDKSVAFSCLYVDATRPTTNLYSF